MQIGGESKRARLVTNLSKYNLKCTIGEEGKTLPDVKISHWGSFDNFVAVEFDNGVKMDIAYDSLEFIEK